MKVNSLQAIRSTISSISFIMKLMYQQCRVYYVYWLIGITLTVANTWISITFLKLVIDFLSAGNFYTAILLSILFPIAMFLLKIIGNIVNDLKITKEEKFAYYLKALLAEKQMQIPFDRIDSHAEKVQYDFAEKAVNESSAGLILQNLSIIISNIISICGVLFVFSYLNFWIIVLLIAIICVNSVGNLKRMQYRYQQVNEETPIERSLYYARDYLTGPVFAKEVRAFGLKDYITSKIKVSIEKYFRLELKTFGRYYKRYWWTYAVNGIQLIAVYLYIGYLLYTEVLTVGDFSAYISSAFVFAAAVLGNITAVAEIAQSGKYTQNLRAFLCWESKKAALNFEIPKLVDTPFTLTMENVYFQYDKDAPFVLKNLSLTIYGKEKISIVGRNGAGKTTLIKLLMGLYQPTKGEIKLNGINIQEFDRQQYLSLFSTVFQDFHIFAFSIEENISMDTHADPHKIDAAVKKAGLQNKIDTLKDGTDTYLTERMAENGTNLSGGEQQLLAIARAIYKDAPICILDEPTAALSPQNEYAVYQKFNEITENKTVVYISHRLASCRLADRIVVLGDGQVVESGSHEQLMKKNGQYALMFSMQSEHYISTKEGPTHETQEKSYSKESSQHSQNSASADSDQ